jgi:hypothetical protein
MKGKRARVRSAGARRFYREDSDRRAVPSMHGVRGTVLILAVRGRRR